MIKLLRLRDAQQATAAIKGARRSSVTSSILDSGAASKRNSIGDEPSEKMDDASALRSSKSWANTGLQALADASPGQMLRLARRRSLALPNPHLTWHRWGSDHRLMADAQDLVTTMATRCHRKLKIAHPFWTRMLLWVKSHADRKSRRISPESERDESSFNNKLNVFDRSKPDERRMTKVLDLARGRGSVMVRRGVHNDAQGAGASQPRESGGLRRAMTCAPSQLARMQQDVQRGKKMSLQGASDERLTGLGRLSCRNSLACSFQRSSTSSKLRMSGKPDTHPTSSAGSWRKGRLSHDSSGANVFVTCDPLHATTEAELLCDHLKAQLGVQAFHDPAALRSGTCRVKFHHTATRNAIERRTKQIQTVNTLFWIQTAQALRNPLLMIDIYWAQSRGVQVVSLVLQDGGWQLEREKAELVDLPQSLIQHRPAAFELIAAFLKKHNLSMALFKQTLIESVTNMIAISFASLRSASAAATNALVRSTPQNHSTPQNAERFPRVAGPRYFGPLDPARARRPQVQHERRLDGRAGGRGAACRRARGADLPSKAREGEEFVGGLGALLRGQGLPARQGLSVGQSVARRALGCEQQPPERVQR